MNCLPIDTQATRPRAHGFAFSVAFNPVSAVPVFQLRENVSPSAVAWFVIARAINSVKGAAIRALAHVFKKAQEIVPPRTHFNCCIPLAVLASVVHPIPAVPSWRAALSVSYFAHVDSPCELTTAQSSSSCATPIMYPYACAAAK